MELLCLIFCGREESSSGLFGVGGKRKRVGDGERGERE